MNNSENESINIEVTVPMLKLRKILPFTARDIVRKLKIDLLNCQELQSLEDGWNFGFFMPGNKEKAGKYLDEERFLNEYFFNDNTKRKKFLECVKKNDIKKTNQLISDGLDPNFTDPTGEVTPLIAAVLQKKSKDLIYSLLEGGAHLDFRNKRTLTPLHVAAMKGKDDAVKSIFKYFKLLLELGSSANYRDGQMLTPLYVGVKHDITKYSLKKLCYEHADTDVVDNHDNTSLHQACRLGKYDLLEDLIAYSRDINKQNHLGNTALHLAAVQKQEECTKMLLERGANKYIVNHSGKTAADLCTSESLKQFIQTFEESQKIQNAVPPKYNLNRKVSSSLSNNDEALSNGALISSFSKSLSNLSKKEEENNEPSHEKLSISLTNETDNKFSSQKFNNGKIRNHKQSHIINGNSDDDDSDDDCSPPLIRKKLQNYCRIVTINPGHEGLGFILSGAAGIICEDFSDYMPIFVSLKWGGQSVVSMRQPRVKEKEYYDNKFKKCKTSKEK
ncbi:hypothetical protein HELRODRAFT_158378 [Helobdella robusta]|uniref:Uncharacterized protein n=1 Tax=Helobdella robusta TaxID=6412 RepID=T1EMQ5_HELRO|nr:hypothetical protein HELRODRAFT_158378 [Helobdella robusta]ESO11993.1 hypothetical protein HELRODRAFT_158378 [Helobdella robusta]